MSNNIFLWVVACGSFLLGVACCLVVYYFFLKRHPKFIKNQHLHTVDQLINKHLEIRTKIEDQMVSQIDLVNSFYQLNQTLEDNITTINKILEEDELIVNYENDSAFRKLSYLNHVKKINRNRNTKHCINTKQTAEAPKDYAPKKDNIGTLDEAYNKKSS